MTNFPVRAYQRKWLSPVVAGLLCLASQPARAADDPAEVAPKGAAVTVLKAAKACFVEHRRGVGHPDRRARRPRCGRSGRG